MPVESLGEDEFTRFLRSLLGFHVSLRVSIRDDGGCVELQATNYLPYDYLRWVDHVVEKLGGERVSDAFMRETWKVPKRRVEA